MKAPDTPNAISAKTGRDIEELKNQLYNHAGWQSHCRQYRYQRPHYEVLKKIRESLLAVKSGIGNGLTGGLLTVDVRRALYYLEEIIGQVEIDHDILGTIFRRFCIGK